MMRARILAAVAGGVMLALLAEAPAQAAEPWIGRWSIDPAGCTTLGDTASTSPLIVTDKTLTWFVASCRIGKLYKTGQDAHIQAHCSSEGRVRDIPISLKPKGSRMKVVWDNAPVEEMRRCQ
jgi:hypothetical protein